MDYKLSKNKILVLSKDDFNPQHILECGQIFAYEKTQTGYVVFSKDNRAEIIETPLGYDILTENPKYFENFFDLKTDYSKIKQKLMRFDLLKEPIRFGYGIRILKNDLFETLVSFIISANNNIKRIQNIIKALKLRFSKDGKFPSHQQLLSLSQQDFYDIGLGYRSPQLYKTLRQVDEKLLEQWRSLSTADLREKLLALSGVGPKVADCIMLFGYGKKDVFPVDTWINQMYNQYYSPLGNRQQIRKNLVAQFKDLSGYAQQYLFYFQRSKQPKTQG